ncbi:MAG: alpha-hydroxy-acid oxidizing protein [Actinomycetota bacterium]|nr:alpha-hydroxy-acid oxidizing protein [Actinomycetota bacterium]
MSTRRIPKWAELAPLLQPRRPALDPTSRRLASVASIADLRRAARRRAPRAVFDYTDGAAGDELTLARMRDAYDRVEFRPTVLTDVSAVDPSATILGRRSELPLVLAPTGFTRMMHTEGERAVGRVAGRAGIPYALSTMGTTSIERLASEAPDTRLWFQLYLWKDRVAGRDFVARAAEAGYETLVLTVDTPVPGPRRRDVRNGLTIPPSLTLKTFLDGATRPAWWFDLLTTEPLEFASLTHFEGTVADMIAGMFDPAATLADVEWLRQTWKGPLVVKGIQNGHDAKAVVDAGADAVIVSNHGGRQLDRAPVPLEELPRVLDAVGDRAEVYVDGGIMSGGDVVAAVALGARAALVGRAYLYGLMAGGERGVQKAIDILTAEIRSTMALLGVTSVAHLGPHHVRLRPAGPE